MPYHVPAIASVESPKDSKNRPAANDNSDDVIGLAMNIEQLIGHERLG